MDISIVLPAYNEEMNIVTTINAFVLLLNDFKYEIIVVDDGSVDKTKHNVLKMQNTIPNIVYVEHESNKGYGAALRSGFTIAKGKWCFFTDSDLQFDVNDFHKLWASRFNYDVILGYRSPRMDPLFRKINASLWGRYINFIYGINVKDLNCAFKLFKTDLIQTIDLKSDGAFINAEILAHFSHKTIPFHEVPVKHYSRLEGEQTGAKLSVIYGAFRESISLRYKLK